MAGEATDRDDPLAGLLGDIQTTSSPPAAKAPSKAQRKPTPAEPKAGSAETARTPVPAPAATRSTVQAVSEAHGFASREGKRDRRRGRKTKLTVSRNFRISPETDQRLDVLLDALGDPKLGELIDQATQLLLEDCKKKGMLPNG